jgi:hypothetical protein
LNEAPRRRAITNLALQAQPDVAFTTGRAGGNAARNFTAGVSLVTGQQPNNLPSELPWLHEPKKFPPLNGSGVIALTAPTNSPVVFAPKYFLRIFHIWMEQEDAD